MVAPPEETSSGTTEAEIGGPVTIENPDLIGAIVTQMFKDSAYTSNALIDSHKSRADKAEAELAAVRWKVETLLSGDYAPSHLALLRALYPSEAAIKKFVHVEESV